MKDILTEWEHGEGAIKVCGKVMLMRREKGTLIAGLIFPDIISDNNKEDLTEIGEKIEELWEVEMIIKPINKYAGYPEEQWGCLDIGQKLCSAWSKGWKKKL